MSKYGPAWVWPAARGAPDQPLPSKPSCTAASPPLRTRTLGGLGQSQGAHPPGLHGGQDQPKTWRGSPKGEVAGTGSGKGKMSCLGAPQARGLPAVPAGSDATLTHGGGLAHQSEWGGRQRLAQTTTSPRCSDGLWAGATHVHLESCLSPGHVARMGVRGAEAV